MISRLLLAPSSGTDNFFWNYKLYTFLILSMILSYTLYAFLNQFDKDDYSTMLIDTKKHGYLIELICLCIFDMILCIFSLIALFNQSTLIFRVDSVAHVSAHSIWYNYFYGTFMGNPFIFLVLPFWWLHEYIVHRMVYYRPLLKQLKYGRFLSRYYQECAQFNWFETYQSMSKDKKPMKYHYVLLWLNILIEFVSLGLFFGVGIYHIWLFAKYGFASFNAFKYLLVYGLCFRVNTHFVHYYQNHFLNVKWLKWLKAYYLNGFNVLISMKHNEWIRNYLK